MATIAERVAALESWKTDHVKNNAKVTADVAALKTQVSNLSTKVSALEVLTTTLDGDLTDLENVVIDLEARIKALEEDIPVPVPAPTITHNITAGQTLSGTIQWLADTTNTVSVEFSVDGVVKALDSASPFVYMLDTRTVSNGNHNLQATATGSSGLTSLVQTGITINNPVVPPPNPGFTTIQAAVNSATAGSIITVPAGTYKETVTIGKSLILLGSNVIVDGENSRQHAFIINANDVTLDGFEVKNHRPPYQRGAIRVTAVSRATIKNCNSHDNPGPGKGQDSGNHNTIGGGISFTGGTGHIVEDSTIQNNETAGIHINGFGDGTQSGMGSVIIRRALIKNNNPGGYNIGWHSGGVKFTKTDGLTIEDCIVTGNRGDGLWGDIDAKNTTIQRNKIDHNSFSGIHYEISDLATIEGNTLWENGWSRTDGWGWGASIQVVECRRININNNLVAWSNRGISLLGNVDPNRKGAYPVSKPGSYDMILPAGNTIISSDGYLLFWGSGVPANVDTTAKYWSAIAPVSSSGPTCVVNLTTAQRDAILIAAGIPTSHI